MQARNLKILVRQSSMLLLLLYPVEGTWTNTFASLTHGSASSFGHVRQFHFEGCIFIEFILVRQQERYTAEYVSENATPTESERHAGLTEIRKRTTKMKYVVRESFTTHFDVVYFISSFR